MTDVPDTARRAQVFRPQHGCRTVQVADDTLPADPSSLNAEVAHDVALLRQFAINREQAMASLFGRKVRVSPARDELLRLIVMAFSEGRCFRTSYYRDACSYFENAQAVNREIGVLESYGLVRLQADPRFIRARLVVPTRKLVTFYNTQMPRLRAGALAVADAAVCNDIAPGCKNRASDRDAMQAASLELQAHGALR